MPLKITELPLDAPLKKKAELSKENIRKTARLIIKDYDEDNFIVGIKRGVVFVKKLLVGKKDGDHVQTAKDVEKQILASILAGDYDKDIIDGYEFLKPGKKARRGRRKKAVSEEATARRGRPKKAAGKKATSKKGRPKGAVSKTLALKKASGKRGRPKGSKNKPKEVVKNGPGRPKGTGKRG